MSKSQKDVSTEADTAPLTLNVGRRHFCSIRQFVTKIDQFLYLLEFDRVMFPAYTNKRNKNDFLKSLNCAKKSIDNLKNQLFKLSDDSVPRGRKYSALRYNLYRKERKLSDTVPMENNLDEQIIAPEIESEIEVIDIADDLSQSEIAHISVANDTSNSVINQQTEEAALSLLSIRNRVKDNVILKKPETLQFKRPTVLHLKRPEKLKSSPTTTIWSLQDAIEKCKTDQSLNFNQTRPDVDSLILNLKNMEAAKMTSVIPFNKNGMPSLLFNPEPVLSIDGVLYKVSEVDIEWSDSNIMPTQ